MNFTEAEMEKTYACLEDYFTDHPDEEDDFYDDMAILAEYEDMLELPEDWKC